jgi:hypothetical protein
MDTDAMILEINNFVNTLNENEIDLFSADLEDAVSGVIEDWKGKNSTAVHGQPLHRCN